MCGTTYSSLESSNYRRMITHRASESVLLSVINGLGHLTKLTTSNCEGVGTARPIRFENCRIGQSLSNWIKSDGWFEFESNLEASQVPRLSLLGLLGPVCSVTMNCSVTGKTGLSESLLSVEHFFTTRTKVSSERYLIFACFFNNHVTLCLSSYYCVVLWLNCWNTLTEFTADKIMKHKVRNMKRMETLRK